LRSPAQARFAAARPPLQPHRRLVGAGIGIGRERLGLQHDPGIEVDHAFRAEPETLLADGDVAGEPAVEIFGGGVRDPLIDARAQRLTDIYVLARNAKRHGRPRITTAVRYQESASRA